MSRVSASISPTGKRTETRQSPLDRLSFFLSCHVNNSFSRFAAIRLVFQYRVTYEERFCESAGLGLPPAKLTTNASESLNAAIKRKVDFKESDWPQYISHMKQYVESQQEEVIRYLSGRGQYRLLPIVAHYGVPTQSWIKMTPEQRREVVTAFENTKLPRNCSYQMEENLESTVDTSFQAETILSVSAEDSGIISIPLVTLRYFQPNFIFTNR